MEVYRIDLNVTEFQWLIPEDSTVWNSDILTMNCKAKLNTWIPLKVYVHNPLKSSPNIFNICPGGFAIDSECLSKLPGIFEWGCELLPLICQGRELWLVNVLECVNCLNDEGTVWAFGKRSNAKIRIEQFDFYQERFSESPLFKIPETYRKDIFTITGINDVSNDFKHLIETCELKGLIFDKVWSR